jgi:hypothetical protein
MMSLSPGVRWQDHDIGAIAPIGSYDGFQDKTGGELVINWPPEIIMHYQEKFIPGYALTQA